MSAQTTLLTIINLAQVAKHYLPHRPHSAIRTDLDIIISVAQQGLLEEGPDDSHQPSQD